MDEDSDSSRRRNRGGHILSLLSFGLLGSKDKPETQSEQFERGRQEVIDSLEEQAAESGVAISSEEKRMIDSILRLSRTTAKQIMVPRVDIVGFPQGTPLEELRPKIKEGQHSRYPIYSTDLDYITGMITVKDLYAEDTCNHADDPDAGTKTAGDIAREVIYIPETKKVNEILKEMKLRKIHMAVVLDEYGGTAGLLTLEDVLEEIVGEIEDEYDIEPPPVVKLNETTLRVEPNLSLEEFGRLTGIEITAPESDTVGGLIYYLVGGVPEDGQTLEYGNVSFVVEKMSGQRIESLRVQRLDKSE